MSFWKGVAVVAVVAVVLYEISWWGVFTHYESFGNQNCKNITGEQLLCLPLL